MKKERVIIACAIALALLLGVFMHRQTRNPQSDVVGNSEGPLRPGSQPFEANAENIGTAPLQLPRSAPTPTPNQATGPTHPASERPQTSPRPNRQEVTALRAPDPEQQRLRSTLGVSLGENQVLVTGGFTDDQGMLRYATIQHQVVREDGKPAIVSLNTKIIAVSAERAEAVGLDSMLTAADDVIQHGEIWTADEYAKVIAELATAPDLQVISSPMIAFAPNQEAMIELGKFRTQVLATAIDDDDRVEFELTIEQPRDGQRTPAQ